MAQIPQTNLLKYNWDKFISRILGDVIDAAAVLSPSTEESKLATLILAQRGFDSALLSDFVDLVSRLEQRNMTGTMIKIKDVEYVPTTIMEYSYHLRRLDGRGGLVICTAPRAILLATYRPTIQPIQALPFIEKIAEDLKTI